MSTTTRGMCAFAFGLLCASASAQFSTAVAPTPASSAVTTVSPPSGSFLMGVDNCNNAHTNAGVGNVAGVPYTTGTTGATGQNEALCLIGGVAGIHNDVWFDWTATMTGMASLDTCGGTPNTKIAIYPLAICPANGTAIACGDDLCGTQTGVSWAITNGTQYTIQLGTLPGTAGGAGTFRINQTALPSCGRNDDGTAENGLGLTPGGEIGWLTVWATGPSTCLATWDAVETAYGTSVVPGSVVNGSASRVVAYHDADTDKRPTTGLSITAQVNTVVVNGGTDILNRIPLGVTINKLTDSDSWTLVTADHAGFTFPAPMDRTLPIYAPGVWVVGSTLGPGTLNTANLNANDIAPINMAAANLPTNWLSRVADTTNSFPAVCFGDGSGAPCPCFNNGGAGAGCANGTGGGGVLSASGVASVSNDTMSLTANGVINDNGLFFQGNNTIAGGMGIPFGDGLRCCGGSVVRIQVVNPPGMASPATAQMTETATTNGPPGTITAGTTKCYQYWYRDPATSPCGVQFNLTNGVTTIWIP